MRSSTSITRETEATEEDREGTPTDPKRRPEVKAVICLKSETERE